MLVDQNKVKKQTFSQIQSFDHLHSTFFRRKPKFTDI